MDNWVLMGPSTLVKKQQSEFTVKPTQVKVKVSHILLSNYDALMYSGDIKVNYPRTLGRFAVGIVTEAGSECYGISAGARVYLRATLPCKECYECRSGDTEDCTNIRVAGRDYDGFMRDFVVCEYNEVAVIPESVDDLHALCIENVGLAEKIFDQLNLSVGSKVAIIGAGFFGSILTQIALYHKLVPIVVDNYPDNLERLKRCGIYYAFPADDSLLENVSEATSGAMCDGAVYSTCCKLSPTIPSAVLAKNKDLILGGFSTVNFKLDVQPLFDKGLRISSVTDGYGYTEAAINMLVHGAINLDSFDICVLNDFDPAKLLTERLKDLSYTSRVTVLKLIL
jgi:L-iditol 2-dehydrogenase